jgi:hypothetical protein
MIRLELTACHRLQFFFRQIASETRPQFFHGEVVPPCMGHLDEIRFTADGFEVFLERRIGLRGG